MAKHLLNKFNFLVIILNVLSFGCSNNNNTHTCLKSEHNLKPAIAINEKYDLRANLAKIFPENDKINDTALDMNIASSCILNLLAKSADLEKSDWANIENNHRGSFEITATYGDVKNKLVCRKFTHTLKVDNKESISHGQACRKMWDPEAKWLITLK